MLKQPSVDSPPEDTIPWQSFLPTDLHLPLNKMFTLINRESAAIKVTFNLAKRAGRSPTLTKNN